METLFPNTEPTTSSQKEKNLFAIVIILTGLFVGGLFVDITQLVLGQGFSNTVVKKHNLLETPGKTWVAYTDPKVTVQVVTDKDCTTCDPSEALVWLRRVIPTIEASPIESNSDLGKLLIERFQILSLPAFIFSKNIVHTDFYDQASSLFDNRSERFFFNMSAIGLPVGKYTTSPAIKDTDIIIGSKNAPVKIVEYSDFQCQYCKIFQFDINTILKEYAGKVVLIYKHLPLSSSHPQAENAALASSCANEQGKFQAYADHLFAQQAEWGKTTGTQRFKDYAWRFGMNGREFATCLDTKKYQEKMNADREEAEKFSIQGTPSTFINKTFLPGAVSKDVLKQTIDAELAK